MTGRSFSFKVNRGALAVITMVLATSCKHDEPGPPPAAVAARSGSQLQRGYQLHQEKCGNCHSLQNPAAFSKVQLTDRIMPEMARKAGLSQADARDVLAYLLAARELGPGARLRARP